VNRMHDVSQMPTADLERARRELKANLGMLYPDSPAHRPVQAQMQAIDTELAARVLAALAREYEKEWVVSKPGRYAADHRKIDVSLISDSVEGLAEKLRAFAELLKELP